MGEWSAAIWDAPLRTVHLARDYMGVRPLFYAVGSAGARSLMWSSEPRRAGRSRRPRRSAERRVRRRGNRPGDLADDHAIPRPPRRASRHVRLMWRRRTEKRRSDSVVRFEPLRVPTAAGLRRGVPRAVVGGSAGAAAHDGYGLGGDQRRARLLVRRLHGRRTDAGGTHAGALAAARVRTRHSNRPKATSGASSPRSRRTSADAASPRRRTASRALDADWDWVSPFTARGVLLACLDRVRGTGGRLILSGRMGDAVTGCQPDNSLAVLDDLAQRGVAAALASTRRWSRATRQPFIRTAYRLLPWAAMAVPNRRPSRTIRRRCSRRGSAVS